MTSYIGPWLSRRQFVGAVGHSIFSTATFIGLAGLGACSDSGEKQEPAESPPASPAPQTPPRPKITRIKMGTIGATDLDAIESWYGEWLGYSVVERGAISATLAGSWGTPNMAGRPYLLMQPESGADVYIRAALIDDVPGYRPMTTHGWNSFEIIVEDVYALHERLVSSPFQIIGEPRSLGGAFPTIHAMQVIGPSREVLYLTCETDPTATLLPDPGAFVGRPFIMVLAGPDVAAIQGFYAARFDIATQPAEDTAIAIIARAQGLPEDYPFKLGFSPLAAAGHFIEFDGYPDTTGPRPQTSGQLPPGNAMTSFAVASLDAVAVDFIGPPVRETGLGYGGNRSVTFVGPAGALTELIEEQPEPALG